MMRKILVLSVILATAMAVLAFSGGQTESDEAAGAGQKEERVTISLWYVAVEGNKDAIWQDENLELFAEAHPNIRVERTIIGNGVDYRAKLAAEMASNNPPSSSRV